MKIKRLKTLIVACVSLTLVTQLIGCGTILYPERKGQIDGRIDPGVAVLDAVGLLFFFVPGVIAFAVDFSNGTIYLPSGKRAKLSPTELKLISNDGHINKEEFEIIISSKIGTQVDLGSTNIQISRYNNEQEIAAHFAIYGALLAKL